MAWEILRSIAELVFGLGGLYALYQCMKHLRTMVGAQDVASVWSRFNVLMVWAAVCCGALVLCAFAGGRSLSVVFLATFMSLMVIGAGFMLAHLRTKSLSVGREGAVGVQDGELVEVRSLVQGRVRGRDDSGAEVGFEPDQLRRLVGVRGHVRMLNWTSARKSGDQAGGIMPLMGFRTEDGDSFVLYADDDVVIAKGATT